MAVGRKFSDDKTIYRIPLTEQPSLLTPITEFIRRSLEEGQQLFRPIGRLRTWFPRLTSTKRFNYWLSGKEDCFFYGVQSLVDSLSDKPDIIHCHNLHGGYFNIQSLIELSREFPVILNLRDAWLLTGHCSYFFDCERWKSGCGDCPDISIYPAIRKDRSAENWEMKKGFIPPANTEDWEDIDRWGTKTQITWGVDWITSKQVICLRNMFMLLSLFYRHHSFTVFNKIRERLKKDINEMNCDKLSVRFLVFLYLILTRVLYFKGKMKSFLGLW